DACPQCACGGNMALAVGGVLPDRVDHQPVARVAIDEGGRGGRDATDRAAALLDEHAGTSRGGGLEALDECIDRRVLERHEKTRLAVEIDAAVELRIARGLHREVG